MNTIEQDTTQPRRSLGIRGRLFVGFGSILVIFLIAITIVLIRMTLMGDLANKVINTDLPTGDAYFDLYPQMYQSQLSLQAWVLTHDQKFKNNFELSLQNITRAQNILDQFSQNWPSGEIADWQQLKLLVQQFQDIEKKILNTTDTSIASQLLISELLPQFEKIQLILDGPMNASGNRAGGLFDKLQSRLQHGAQNIILNINTVKLIEYILLTLSLVLGVVIAFLTARKILLPLNHAINIAKKIAAGRRDIDITVTSTDETGQLLTALNRMQNAININEEKLKENEAHSRQLFTNIVNTANTFSAHSSRVAGGDLTQRISIDTNDEMGRLGTDLNTMTESLAGITKQITEACQSMVTTIEEVKQTADMQASGATEQASSINQITASLEEIEKSSTQTIEKAKTLGDVAELTRAKGKQGLDAVEQSVAGMKAVREKVQTIAQTILDLSTQTQQVGEITAAVNMLAQQSKMLALNASMEAAKAGEAGKGFAVVAAEVKNLAEQSEQSTTQVQKILEDIRHATEKAVMATEEGTKGVDLGTGLVVETGEIVRSLSDVIHETTIASQQIAAAIRQEGIGIEQITAGMNEINQVTHASVESVKQATEAITNLATIAKGLKEQIDIYKI